MRDQPRGSRIRRSSAGVEEPDLETEIEDEIAASGHAHVVPRAGLVGAHTERVAPFSAGGDGVREPIGLGAAVAPTRKAEVREQERHQRERAIGRFPAGEDGRTRGQNLPTVTRESLARAAEEADEAVARLTAEGRPPRWRDRAAGWVRENQLFAAAVGSAALGAGIGALARPRRR